MLCKACSLDPKQHSAAQRAVNWKQPTTKHSGNFAAVMEEVPGLHTPQHRQCWKKQYCAGSLAQAQIRSYRACKHQHFLLRVSSTAHLSDLSINMHIAALQYLFIPNCGKHQDSEGERELKVGGLNEKLDELVRAEGDAKAGVLQWLIRHTSPRLMRWILRIILKDMKVPSSLLSRTRTSC